MTTVHKSEETIQGKKLFKGGHYSRAETIRGKIRYVNITDPDKRTRRFNSEQIHEYLESISASVFGLTLDFFIAKYHLLPL